MKIYSNKKRPVKASSNGRKWVNTELTQDEYAKFRNFLKKKGYKYETSGAGDMVHIEAYLNEAEIKEADNFLDTLDNVNGACGKKSVKASNEGRSDLIYVIMVNGDPVAKGSYDAMVKKSYTYSYPVQMLKFPKAKLNSLIKMAKDAHRPDPLKFAVNRFINDNTSEYDSLNASTNRNNVTASTKPSYRSGEEAIRNACNVINVFFAGKEPDMWDDLYNDTNTKYFVDQHKDRSGGIDTESVVQEWRETYDEEYDPRDYLFNILRDQLGYSYDEAERMLIYASTRRRPVRASITSGNIPYDLVSMLVALRDWVSIDDTDYINDEHRKLVDVADSLYNVGISVNEMSPEYQEVYNKYGKDFFDLVLDDVAALDSQLTSNNVNDLIEDYNDREASYTGVNASTKRRRNTKVVKASEIDELEEDPFINALWEACDDVPQLVEINYEATDGIIFIFNHTTDDYDGREASLINSLEAAGYDAEYLANNGSNVIVLDVKEKGVNASVSSRKAVKASELTDVNGYAVQIHDMHDAMYDLLLFGNREDAEWASEQLEIISNRADNGELDDYEYRDMISDVFNMSDDYIEEINFRTEIDRNNIWTAFDDSKWQIVNPVSVSLWL